METHRHFHGAEASGGDFGVVSADLNPGNGEGKPDVTMDCDNESDHVMMTYASMDEVAGDTLQTDSTTAAAATAAETVCTPELARVEELKTRLAGLQWRARVTESAVNRERTLATERVARLRQELEVAEEEAKRRVGRAEAEHDAVTVEMSKVESELNKAVNQPLKDGRDPTEWLPDEILMLIFLLLPFKVLWTGTCSHVCQRWATLSRSGPVVRRRRDGRWNAYACGEISPMVLRGHTDTVWALAVGPDGNVYSGSMDRSVRVWSARDGTHVQTLTGHAHGATALAIAGDGRVHSGSWDRAVRVWRNIRAGFLLWPHVGKTLRGHTRNVRAIAIASDGKVYSAGEDRTVRVWSGTDGDLLCTLRGHSDAVLALAIGPDGKVYSGSYDRTVGVWSGRDGTHINTLRGHTHAVRALATGAGGELYSGSADATIRVWSGRDGSHLRTLLGHSLTVRALAVGNDGTVYSGSTDGTIRVWCGRSGAHLRTLRGHSSSVTSIAIAEDGKVFSGSSDTNIHVW